MKWFAGRVEVVPFSPVSVMAGYLLLITPVSIGLVVASVCVLVLDIVSFRSNSQNPNAEAAP
jgi:hypothetical protein